MALLEAVNKIPKGDLLKFFAMIQNIDTIVLAVLTVMGSGTYDHTNLPVVGVGYGL